MNNPSAWFQFALYLGLLLVVTKPLGLYLLRVARTLAAKTLARPRVEAGRTPDLPRLCGIDPERGTGLGSAMQTAFRCWCSAWVGMLFILYVYPSPSRAACRSTPQHFPGLAPHLAFNTAASFATNTNWQSYSGENTMSYFSQMVGLTWHNFLSAASGIAIAAALVRGIARHSAKTIGNFWVDIVRVSTYLLAPLCLIFALVLVSQGMIQNFQPYTTARTVENGSVQTIPQGPMASQVAIKMLGTNGGGSSRIRPMPRQSLREPDPVLQLHPDALRSSRSRAPLTYYLGRMVKKPRHGWAVWGAMAAMFVAGVLVAWKAEAAGNPIHQKLGVAAADGNMEGKEVRFGIFNSALFATITTDASCGAVNAMHDSFTPIGGLVPLFNIQTGEVIFGGVGAGLYGMMIFVILAVFIAGLMVRAAPPEYSSGKKSSRLQT